MTLFKLISVQRSANISKIETDPEAVKKRASNKTATAIAIYKIITNTELLVVTSFIPNTPTLDSSGDPISLWAPIANNKKGPSLPELTLFIDSLSSLTSPLLKIKASTAVPIEQRNEVYRNFISAKTQTLGGIQTKPDFITKNFDDLSFNLAMQSMQFMIIQGQSSRCIQALSTHRNAMLKAFQSDQGKTFITLHTQVIVNELYQAAHNNVWIIPMNELISL